MSSRGKYDKGSFSSPPGERAHSRIPAFWSLVFLIFTPFLFLPKAHAVALKDHFRYCICHKEPQKQDQTLVISEQAVCTHVTKHGDTSGPCAGAPESACEGAPGIEGIECGEPICGDGICLNGENCNNCPQDCGECGKPFCGDGVCEDGEKCSNCPQDCGFCPGPFCGDGLCNIPTETCDNCQKDCGSCPGPHCGDGTCDPQEECSTCPSDCGTCPGPFCGDGVCNSPTETCSNCEKDCDSCEGPHCGDGTCDPEESCTTCPSDCGTCPGPFCGDKVCDIPNEDCSNCETDCGSCTGPSCGNGVCDTGESCTTCPSDCGVCPCPDRDQDGVCDSNDNCPDSSNPNQEDSNQNGIGDACENDQIGAQAACINQLKSFGLDQDTAVSLASLGACLGITEGGPSCSLEKGSHWTQKNVIAWALLFTLLSFTGLRSLSFFHKKRNAVKG